MAKVTKKETLSKSLFDFEEKEKEVKPKKKKSNDTTNNNSNSTISNDNSYDNSTKKKQKTDTKKCRKHNDTTKIIDKPKQQNSRTSKDNNKPKKRTTKDSNKSTQTKSKNEKPITLKVKVGRKDRKHNWWDGCGYIWVDGIDHWVSKTAFRNEPGIEPKYTLSNYVQGLDSYWVMNCYRPKKK